MIRKKGKVSEVEIRDELKKLVPNRIKKEVVIGDSVYEIYPFSALEIYNILAEINDIIDIVRKKKYEEMIKYRGIEGSKVNIDINSIEVSVNDVLRYKESRERVIELLREVLKGVDEEDFNNMTITQVGYLINSLIEINLNTLPSNIRNQITGRTDIESGDINIDKGGKNNKTDFLN